MTPEQFNKLDEAEQAEVIWEGVHIADRQDREHREHNILLYKIDNLYVEIYYHIDYNVIRKFEAFTELELFDIYTYRETI